MPRPKEFLGLWVQALADSFKLLLAYLSAQAKQLRPAAMPFPSNAAVLIVVIAVFEMTLSIPGTARQGSDREHNPTLSPFEIRLQWPSSEKQ
jgi:hypothetical protein